MSDTIVVSPGADEVSVPAEGPLNVREAVAALNQRRDEQVSETEKRGPDGRFKSQQESAPTSEAVAAPPPEAPSETIEADPPAEPDPIEPPRSWTKEDKEAFAELPRETQERVAEAEKKRERALRTQQNEQAELRKRHEAELRATMQARQQYQQILPQMASAYQSVLTRDFPDIKGPEDVQRLALENPARYSAWDAAQKVADSYQRQAQAVFAAQEAEKARQWQQWTATQDAKVLEAIPDLADKEKSAQVLKEAEAFLKDIGFTNDELRQHYSGQRSISMRDARLQQVVWEAAQYRKARSELKRAQTEPKPAPKLQRPGSPRTAQDAGRAKIQNLEKQFSEASGAYNQARIAAQLRAAKRSLAS